MTYRLSILTLAVCLACTGGCGLSPSLSDAVGSANAVIVGRISTSAGTAKLLSVLDGECPDVVVSVNGAPVSIEFNENCEFVIGDIQSAQLVEVRVELVDLGVAGTIELSDVVEGELLEILVEPRDDSLTITVERRATPIPSNDLPDVIQGNNVTLSVPAGLYDHGLEVRGNNFTLVGEAGDDCGTNGWTEIDGDVLVLGNNATFRNIQFAGLVEVRGNDARFINCCFGDLLEVFGNGALLPPG